MAFAMECLRCSNDYVAKTPEVQYCPQCRKANKGKADRPKRIVRPTDFVGVDGEGYTDDDGEHHYVLLSVGDRSYTNQGKALHWSEVLEFLWDCYLENPKAIYVGFFLGYDFTQWFKSLPENRARSLLTNEGIGLRVRKTEFRHLPPWPVDVDKWQIDTLNMRRVKLRPQDSKQWMTICDAGSFYQTSFLNAIDPKGWETPIVTPEDYATILEGKQHRSTAKLDKAMVRYNVTENRVMADLMRSLDEGFKSCDIKLSRGQWFGPGQAAQAWLSNIDAPLGDDIREATPIGAMLAARNSYYGGWFEIFRHGPQPGITYEYDINSAYPYIISQLPDFRYGEWDHELGADYPSGSYVLVRAIVTCGDSGGFGAMQHRMPDGRILRPCRTAGWYWTSELEAAQRIGQITDVEVHEWYRFTPHTHARPYKDIADLYQRRLDVGKNSPAGKALKLMYNSAYGKMAQSVGQPKYANALCASLITSGTRRMICDAIASHPGKSESVLMVATDGVYFDSPHPTLELSPSKLGAWDVTEKPNLSIFMPGVYWDDKARERIRERQGFSFKSRGVSAADLAPEIDRIDALWDSLPEGVIDPIDFPSVTLPIRFGMVTATQALAMNKWFLAGKVYSSDHGTGRTRTVSACPAAKRSGARKQNGVVWSYAWEQAPIGDVWSTPYENAFGAEPMSEEDMFLSAEGMSPSSELVELLFR